MSTRKTDPDIDAAAAIIAEIDDETRRNASNVSSAQRAQLHLLLSIAKSLDSLDRYGIGVLK